MPVHRRDRPHRARSESRIGPLGGTSNGAAPAGGGAPRGAYAVLGLVAGGGGIFVLLFDVLRDVSKQFSLGWLWIAFFSLSTVLMFVEFFRHWRRTLRPMSAAILVIGSVVAAIDLGGLMVHRLFLVWGWGPLLALAAVGLLTSYWLQRHNPGKATRSSRGKPMICAVENGTPNEPESAPDETRT
ncbi:hypothetical protein JW848_03545 [Candidatus Bipolaricaulota bacterium]|nr:hypothetical protein [Candidatus Bipolaricaulota bacterium]